MTNATVERRIYVACLACYNAGRLVGRWIDADQDVDAIESERAAMMDPATGEHDPCGLPHEETAIHDHEGFGDLVGEWTSLADVAKLAALLDEHGDAFAAWYGNETRDLDDDLGELFADAYRGEFESEEDFARDLVDSGGMLHDVPDEVARYFDFESYGRDLFLDGSFWTAGAGGRRVYVFSS